MWSTGFFTADPRKFRNVLQIAFLHTPAEEMPYIVVNPFGGVGGHDPLLGVFPQIVGQLGNRSGGQIFERLTANQWFYPFEQQNPVVNR